VNKLEKVASFLALEGLGLALSSAWILFIRYLTDYASEIIMDDIIFQPMITIGVIILVCGFFVWMNDRGDNLPMQTNGREVFCGITGHISLLVLSVCISHIIFYQPLFDQFLPETATGIIFLFFLSLIGFILCFVSYVKEKPVKKVDTIKAKSGLSQS